VRGWSTGSIFCLRALIRQDRAQRGRMQAGCPRTWCIHESTAKRAGHRSGAVFAEEDSLAHHAPACCAMHPSWFVCRVLCALSVSAVRFCSEVILIRLIGANVSGCCARNDTLSFESSSRRSVQHVAHNLFEPVEGKGLGQVIIDALLTGALLQFGGGICRNEHDARIGRCFFDRSG
jgi:hypothetical protein